MSSGGGGGAVRRWVMALCAVTGWVRFQLIVSRALPRDLVTRYVVHNIGCV